MVDTQVNSLLHPVDSDNTKVIAKTSNYDSYDYYSYYYDDDQWTTQFKEMIFAKQSGTPNTALPLYRRHGEIPSEAPVLFDDDDDGDDHYSYSDNDDAGNDSSGFGLSRVQLDGGEVAGRRSTTAH